MRCNTALRRWRRAVSLSKKPVIASQSAPRSKCPWGTDWRGNPFPIDHWFGMTGAWVYRHAGLPLRGRCQREALAEGEMPRIFLSPSRLRRQPPPRGGLTARRCRAVGTPRTLSPTSVQQPLCCRSRRGGAGDRRRSWACAPCRGRGRGAPCGGRSCWPPPGE